jgi:hypothetical protein
VTPSVAGRQPHLYAPRPPRPPSGGTPALRRKRGSRPLRRLAVAAAAGLLVSGTPTLAPAAEFSARGAYQLEPQLADNVDLDAAARDDRRLAYLEHEFHLVFSLRTGAVEAAVGLELTDGAFGRQNVRDPSNPFDDSTTLQLSPDTETSLVDYFWVRWDARPVTLRAGWFTTDLGSSRFFLGEDGAPSAQLEWQPGSLRLQYTYQKVAERAGISTAPAADGAPAVPAPRSTLVGAGDVDAHYLLLDVRRERLGPLEVRRGAVWGVYAADRRPEDQAHLGVVGGQLDLRLGALTLYGEADYLEGTYEGTVAARLDRGPGDVNDETLTAGARLRGAVAFAGTALDLGYWLTWAPVILGAEGLMGSGDREPGDGRAEDITALTIVHENLDDDFELSRLFGAFVLAGHREYLERVANLTVVKPFLAVRLGDALELRGAAYWLRTTRSVAVTLDGTPTGERSRDLGWQYEASARLGLAPGVSLSVVYAYLAPGPGLRPGGDPAQLLYGNLRFQF